MRTNNLLTLAFAACASHFQGSVARESHSLRVADYLASIASARAVLPKYDNISVIANGVPPPVQQKPATASPDEPLLPLLDNASDEVWDKAECKGAGFLRAMRGTDEEAGQLFTPARTSAASPFTSIDEAEAWGWEGRADLLDDDFTDWGIDRMLRDLGLSDKSHMDGGTMHCMTMTHGYDLDSDGDEITDDLDIYVVDERAYRVTGAHYGFAFDPEGGAIVAMDRVSPQAAGKNRNPPVQGEGLPAVQSSSDIAWLVWKEFGNEGYDIKNLRHFLTLSITNRETLNILARAMRRVEPDIDSVPPWGGFEFYVDTPEGNAILGSPNVQAFSYFLLQHKAELGNMHITKIRVFHDDRDNPGPNMVLYVEPVPADGTTNPSDQQQEGSMPDLASIHANHSDPAVNNATADSTIDTPPGHEDDQRVVDVDKVVVGEDGDKVEEVHGTSQKRGGDVSAVQRRPRRRWWRAML